MMADMNPYKAPEAPVSDVPAGAGVGDEGEAVSVPAGDGWQWIAGGFTLFKQQPGLWIGLVIVWAIIAILLGLIPLIGGIATTLLTPVMLGGLMLGCRSLDNEEGLTFNHLFAGFSTNTGNLVIVGVLQLVAIIAVLIVAALIALVLGLMPALMSGDSNALMRAGPGVLIAVLVALGLMVPVYMALWFAPALVVFRDMTATEAMKTSFRACLMNIVPFLVYGIIGLVLAILASIPFMLGWLVLAPVGIASIYASYRGIFRG